MSPFAARPDPDVHAVVSARSIIWLGDLTEQQKSDVINSTLFAQLAADKQYSGDDIANWYRRYTDVLGTVGWTVQGDEFTAVDYNKASGSIDDTIITTLGNDPEVTKEAFVAVTKLFLVLARSGTQSEANQVLNKSSVTAKKRFASFQFLVASSDSGNLVLKLYAFTYSSSLDIDNAVWFQWKNATLHIQTSTLTMSLNEDVYAKVRQNIENKLAGRKDVVVDLK